MSDIQSAIQAADEKFSTAKYTIMQQLAADIALASEPLQAKADAAVAAASTQHDADVASATASLTGTDVVARLSGGRTRRATVKSVILKGGTLVYTVAVQAKFTPNYDETVADYKGNRVFVPYSDAEFANSIAFKAKLNSSKGRTPDQAFKKEFAAEKAAFASFQASQTPAPAPVAG